MEWVNYQHPNQEAQRIDQQTLATICKAVGVTHVAVEQRHLGSGQSPSGHQTPNDVVVGRAGAPRTPRIENHGFRRLHGLMVRSRIIVRSRVPRDRHLRERDSNPCVVIPTAGGKSLCLAQVAKDAVTKWNGRVMILAHVKELVEQNAGKLSAICPELKVGVYSAGLDRRDTEEPVVVAGIQSVYNKMEMFRPFDLIMVDEVHMVPPYDGNGHLWHRYGHSLATDEQP